MPFVYGYETASKSGGGACPASHSSTGKTFTQAEADAYPNLGITAGQCAIVDSGVVFGRGGVVGYGFNISWRGSAGDMFSADDVGAVCDIDTTSDGKSALAEVSISGPSGPPDAGSVETRSGSPGSISAGSAAAWSLSVELELCFEDTSYSATGYFGSILDAPTSISRRYYKRFKPGGAYSGSVSYGAASASVAGTITGAAAGAEIDDQMFGEAEGTGFAGFWYPGTGGGTWSVTGLGMSAGASFTHSFGGLSAAADGGGCSVTLPGTGGNGYVGAMARPEKQINFSGSVRAMEDAYPDSLNILVSGIPGVTSATCTGGAWSASGSQKHYNFNATLEGDTKTEIAGTYGPVSAVIDSASLATLGEDTRLTRLLMRGKAFGGLTLSHAASTSIDAGTALIVATSAWAGAWAGSGGASVALAGGVGPGIEVTGGGAATRSFDDDVSLSGYPTLRIHIKADAASAPFSVRIESDAPPSGGGSASTKEWSGYDTGATLGTFVDVDIPLSRETSGTGSTSSHDTKWPTHNELSEVVGDVSDYLPMQEGAFFGVWRCSRIVLFGLSAGVTYTIEGVSLTRTAAAPTVDILPTFYRGVAAGSPFDRIDEAWPVQQHPPDRVGESGSSQTYARRFLLGICGGQQVLEEHDSGYLHIMPGSGFNSISPSSESLQSLANNISLANANGSLVNPGWSATVTTPEPASGCTPVSPALAAAADCHYNAAQPATLLYGAGAFYSAGWSYGFDLALGTYQAQSLFDQVEFFAGCSEWGHGPAGTIPLAAILRGLAHGAVLNTDKTPQSGVTVSVTESVGGAGRGTGVSGSDGSYQSGTPYGKGGIAHDVTSEPGNAAKTVSDWVFYSRKRHRFVFVQGVETEGGNPGNFGHTWGFFCRVFIEAGRVRFWRSQGAIPVATSDWAAQVFATAGPLDGWPRLSSDPFGRLHILFHRETGASSGLFSAYETYSDDFGITWSTPVVAIPDGLYPVVAGHPLTGALFRAAFVPSAPGGSVGTIKATYQEAGDPSPSSVFTFQHNSGGLVDLPVKKDGFGISYAHEGGGRWVLSVSIDGEAATSDWESADQGRTWTRT